MKFTLAIVLSTAVAALAVAADVTPAERKIEIARNAVARNPKQADTYADLAIALARRARETSDIEFYAEAHRTLRKALEIDPSNFAALKAEVWILLGQHEFAKALDKAKVLNQRVPDDVTVYGFLTDANAELGKYEDAEKSCQWMLNLRPGNVPALTRTAYLRELFGDLEGAVMAMEMAYQSTPGSESEDRAWILTQVAHVRLLQGRTSVAETLLNQALAMFPGYHYALGNMAKVRTAQKRFDEAVALEKQRYAAAPHAENLYALAEALDRAGRTDEAKKAFADFEQKSLAESERADNSNHELVAYYLDHAKNPREALRIAKREFLRRQDVHTLDIYARALNANGMNAEARTQIDRALAVGIQDPEILRHASAIRGGETTLAESR